MPHISQDICGASVSVLSMCVTDKQIPRNVPRIHLASVIFGNYWEPLLLLLLVFYLLYIGIAKH